MGNLFHGPTPFILLFVVLLLFGAPKLPGLARSLGQSMKILKKEVSSDGDKDSSDTADASAEKPAAAPAEAAPSAGDELAKAKAEAEAAKAEAAALRAAAEQRSDEAK